MGHDTLGAMDDFYSPQKKVCLITRHFPMPSEAWNHAESCHQVAQALFKYRPSEAQRIYALIIVP